MNINLFYGITAGIAFGIVAFYPVSATALFVLAYAGIHVNKGA